MLYLRLLLLTLIFISESRANGNASKNKLKKDIRDYTEADLERLYEEWEKNDEEELSEDKQPRNVHQIPTMNLEEMKKMVTLDIN